MAPKSLKTDHTVRLLGMSLCRTDHWIETNTRRHVSSEPARSEATLDDNTGCKTLNIYFFNWC